MSRVNNVQPSYTIIGSLTKLPQILQSDYANGIGTQIIADQVIKFILNGFVYNFLSILISSARQLKKKWILKYLATNFSEKTLIANKKR